MGNRQKRMIDCPTPARRIAAANPRAAAHLTGAAGLSHYLATRRFDDQLAGAGSKIECFHLNPAKAAI
jgi:hypothetical protein